MSTDSNIIAASHPLSGTPEAEAAPAPEATPSNAEAGLEPAPSSSIIFEGLAPAEVLSAVDILNIDRTKHTGEAMFSAVPAQPSQSSMFAGLPMLIESDEIFPLSTDGEDEDDGYAMTNIDPVGSRGELAQAHVTDWTQDEPAPSDSVSITPVLASTSGSIAAEPPASAPAIVASDIVASEAAPAEPRAASNPRAEASDARSDASSAQGDASRNDAASAELRAPSTARADASVGDIANAGDAIVLSAVDAQANIATGTEAVADIATRSETADAAAPAEAALAEVVVAPPPEPPFVPSLIVLDESEGATPTPTSGIVPHLAETSNGFEEPTLHNEPSTTRKKVRPRSWAEPAAVRITVAFGILGLIAGIAAALVS